MIKLTAQQADRLTDELVNLSRKLNDDTITDLNTTCKNLEEMFQDISFGSNECLKIRELNKKAYDLQQDTLVICNEVKNLLNEAEIEGNE